MRLRSLSSCVIVLYLSLLLTSRSGHGRVTSSTSFGLLKQLSQAAKAVAANSRAATHSPIFFVKQLLQRRPNSPIHRLPLKIVSNGKPNRIIQGLLPTIASKPTQSSILHLPLQFLSNAKPTGLTIGHGLLPQPAIQPLLLRPVSDIIRLPLQFISNARPVGLTVLQRPFQQLASTLHVPTPHITNSNFIHLPLQFLSNARPFGVSVNPFLY